MESEVGACLKKENPVLVQWTISDCLFSNRHKCVSWTVEWVDPMGTKTVRSSLDISSIAGAYDRANPQPKEKQVTPPRNIQQASQEEHPSAANEHPPELPSGREEARPEERTESSQVTAVGSTAETVTPHRGVYFYLHRPQTPTRQPVLIPLHPDMSLNSAFRARTVLEFPTIYTLHESPRELLSAKGDSRFRLEEEYLGTQMSAEDSVAGLIGDDEKTALQENHDGQTDESESGPESGPIDLEDVDEKKVLDVLKQDLSGIPIVGDVT